MRVEISASKITGRVSAPPSKSMAHRALICAFLSGRRCTIKNIAYSDDINATAGALEALGAQIIRGSDSIIIDGADALKKIIADKDCAAAEEKNRIAVQTENGADADKNKNDDSGHACCIIQCGESGSTLRFIIPICMATGRRFKLCGTKRLFSRSLDVYKTLCAERGYEFEQSADSITLRADLRPGVYRVRADISSQFISGLMFILPLLDGDSTIVLEGRPESLPYIRMTCGALSFFGTDTQISDGKIYIPGNQRYRAADYTVEGDWSNAAFFYALNAAGHSVEVTGTDPGSLQGDRICTEHFELIKKSAPVIDVSDCPDLAPVLMAAMAANNGGTLTGTRRLKIKESDRGAAMACELGKMGVEVTTEENRITVGCGIKKPSCTLHGHNDHRIVMALAVLCTVTGGMIDDAQAVNKSMPDFFEKLQSLGAQIRRLED